MTDRIQAIRERREKITPGPWHNAGGDIRDESDRNVAEVTLHWDYLADGEELPEGMDPHANERIPRTNESISADADFIAHTPDDIKDLLERVEKAEAALAEIQRNDLGRTVAHTIASKYFGEKGKCLS